MTLTSNFEAAALAMEQSGNYRIARRLQPRRFSTAQHDRNTRLALVVDVETTGLDPTRDEIIELAMTPITYGLDGTVHSVGESFHGLQEPSFPIPPRITEITGLTDKCVAGHRINFDAVASFVEPASLVIAHNAAFDRRFLERVCDGFSTKPWACSLTQIDWTSEGFEGSKLAYLAQASGFFYDRHRAENDCLATIELLSNPLPRSGTTGLKRLLEAARRPTYRIWAEHSPYSLKDTLKSRGYRWNAIAGVQPRSWYVDVGAEGVEEELRFLECNIYGSKVDLTVQLVDAYDRFSDRA